ncbi:MAG: hypothetical protein WCJ56_04050 [bacterium]
MTKRLLAILLVAMSIFLLQTGACAREKVWLFTVSTSATGAEAVANDTAVTAAKRRAVSKATEVWVNRDNLAVNEKALNETIYSHADTYVQSWKIKKYDYADNKASMVVDVNVNTVELGKAIGALSARMMVTSKPRVLVDIIQLDNGDDYLQAEKLVTAALTERGFTVVDAAVARDAKYRDVIRLFRERKHQEADALALRQIADVIITGTVKTRLSDEAAALGVDVKAYGCEAWLDAAAISTDTGNITTSARGATQKIVLGFRQEKVIADAVNNATDDWLSKALPAMIMRAIDPAKTFTLRVTDCSAVDVERITSQLIDLPLIRAVRLASLDAKMAEFEIEYLSDSTALVTDLNHLNDPGIKVGEVTGVVIRGKCN